MTRAFAQRPERLLSRPVRLWLGLLGVLLVATLAVGFVWLPSVKADFQAAGWWQALCRAAGVPASWDAGAEGLEDRRASRVALDRLLSFDVSQGDVGRGGTLALRCTMCHGARGVSGSDVPNLAGQYPEVIYKQLQDYAQGQRVHALMQALASGLSEQDLRDLAAFYAQLPRPAAQRADRQAPALVSVGAPLRGMAPCASCHGGIDHKPGSPWLEGMPQPYLLAQLQAYASGQRRNDVHAVMRHIARQMTPEEMAQAAAWYAGQPRAPGAQ